MKKMLLAYRGLLILAVCLLLKAVFLYAFPELKDSRILLSQKQYDKYLVQLHGEDTAGKPFSPTAVCCPEPGCSFGWTARGRGCFCLWEPWRPTAL